MSTAKITPNEALLRGERGNDLQELLRKVGLEVEYWLPKFLEHLGVTCVQSLQNLHETDLQKLKALTQHSWEKKALDKMLDMSCSNNHSKLQEYQLGNIKRKQSQAEKEQELSDLWSEERQQQEEREKGREIVLRQAMEIPKEIWPPSKKCVRNVKENRQQQLNFTKQTLFHRQNLSDRELVRWASGGLALQGIYKTSFQRDLLEKREELLSVPKEFSLFGPEQGTRMEKKEFTSSQAESIFTQTIEKLGFSVTLLAKDSCWGCSFETVMNQSNYKECKETEQSCPEQSYFCSTKFMYVPLVSCYFCIDELQFSKAALRELKSIEDLIEQPAGPDKDSSLRCRIEDFFQRFGSHANQGPLHLGGIYWWKAISEGFQSEELKEVKKKSTQTLENYIRDSYHGLGVDVVDESFYISNTVSQNSVSSHLQTKIKLSMAQTGGPPEANGLIQWKNGLVASNQTWFVIDRGLQLVPTWDIILSKHRTDFNNPLKVANYLKDNYTYMTGLTAQIQEEKYLISAGKRVRTFLETVKSWEILEPEAQLKKLIDFMQILNEKEKSYDSWINLCLTDCDLQNFLVNTFEFCKNSSMYSRKFIKSQFRQLLDPHINSVRNFPQAQLIMQWICQAESEENENISQLSKLIMTLTESLIGLKEIKTKPQTYKTIEEVQKESTYKVSQSLKCFLNYLQETQQPDKGLLLLSIAVGTGYNMVNNSFQQLLGQEELEFLLSELQTAYDKYEELKDICTYRAQAFLVLTGLTVTTGVKAVSPEEKTLRLTLIKQHIGQLLTKEIIQVLSNFEIDHDWDTLEKNLTLLINGDYETIMSSLPENEENQLPSLFYEDGQLSESNDNKNYRRKVLGHGDFLELLQRLGLKESFPKKMNRADFHLIYKTSVYKTLPSSEQELPFYFLQKLLMLDCDLRQMIFKDNNTKINLVSMSRLNQVNEASDAFKDISEENENIISLTNSRSHIHPMDIQMAILHCADDFARQDILGKLFTCQFALPLLVPNPCSSQVEFYLWSLSQIRRSWQQKKKLPHGKNYNNQQMCQVSTPIVSFIRVGEGLSASKSQIMNHLLSKSQHDIFFHRHCKGSSNDCLLMGGVVEICWFCPSGEKEDRFDSCLTFANLHGNAKEYQQQLTFLQEVSSLIVVLKSTSDDQEENHSVVHNLCQSKRPVILLLDDEENSVAYNSNQKVKIGIKNRNYAELTEELTTTINNLLKASGSAYSLQDCANIAHMQGFLVDEFQGECKEAKEEATNLMHLLQAMDISQVKENLLPLQGQLWYLWCKKDRELYHLKEEANRSIEQQKSDIDKEKKTIRHQQLNKALPLNDLMRSVLQILQENSETHTKLYFLQWLTLFFDNLSGQNLEKLNEQKKTLKSFIQVEKQKSSESDILRSLGNDIEAISINTGDCNLGIEHLLREVGQIYEALEESSSINNMEEFSLSLPQIAADLLITGAPIELMDGETSYVPLKWVAAVFDKVTEKLGDKRLFVLSILGMQNSGKSTLLNALFGLQFSAGRCTWGAYMQLVKVEEIFAEELGFDFLLVVDTEGLQNPELSNESQNHNNELATFISGLANLTLINIWEENPSEMQDVLQIVSEAFLRMNQIKMPPSYLFVHQNIGEVPANVQTMERQGHLIQRLDEILTTTAEQKQCSDGPHFSDIFKCDANSQVHYIPHLWDSNLPMAPPNPHYKHNIQELKHQILETAKQQSKKSIMKISDVKVRIQDLWLALVSENFVFSFRNTQEVLAMRKLETMYNHWTWELRSQALTLQNQLMNQVQNEKMQTLEVTTFVTPVTEKYDAIMQEIENYFNEDPDKEILVQWKPNFENKIGMLKEVLISDIQIKVNKMIRVKKSQEILANKQSECKKELLKRSQEFALTLKGKELSEQQLHDKFSQLWKRWLCDVTSTLYPIPEPDVDMDSETILLKYFNREKIVVDTIRGKSQEEFQIDYKRHVQTNKYFLNTKLEDCDKEFINNTTDQIISRFYEKIDNIREEQHDYNANHFYDVLRIIEEGVKSAHIQGRCTFSQQYIIDLSLSLFKKASQLFKDIHREFKQANDPVRYLERERNELYTSFKISCQKATSITTFVDFLWHKLTPAISATILNRIAPKMANHMRTNCPEFNGNRFDLEKYILISLAEEENFDNYWQYIHNPQSFFNNYIESQIKQFYSDNGSKKITIFFKIILDDIKNNILSAIHESTEITKEKNSMMTASAWLDFFCAHLGRGMVFPRKDLLSIEHQEIKDIDLLRAAMSGSVDPAMKAIEQNFLSLAVEELIPQVRKMLSEQLLGCWIQCPFCRAICTNTIPAHDGDHSVPVHRPQAVSGWRWRKTNHFAIEFCTCEVVSNHYFIIDKGRFPFKNYRQAGGIYATWSIIPDSSTLPYWKWFVCHFSSKLEEKYQLKFEGKGQIPDTWYEITKQDVIDDLRKQ